MRYGKYRFIASFLAVPLLLYIVFVVSPYLQAIYISMTDWRGFSANRNFIGLGNYVELAGEVKRAMHVTVKARDMNDKEVRVKASGFLARALQHEIEHLDGILFIDLVEDKDTLRYEPFEDEDVEGETEAVVAPDTLGQGNPRTGGA
jgi:ABC-type sugar transport system permease subunit